MIGLFDSGIGGLTVVREVERVLPGVKLMYFGDTARTPYGNKSAEVVRGYGLEAADFLISRGATAMVVACNTVSAVGLGAIRECYPDVPVFDVISPAVAAVSAIQNVRRVGIMGTRSLVAGGVYQRALGERVEVVAHTAPLLVPLAEEGWLHTPEAKRIVKRYLVPFKQAQVQVLVLACTHYPLLKPAITARVGRKVRIIDPAEFTARSVAAWATENPERCEQGKSEFFVTDAAPHTREIASRFLQREVGLIQVDAHASQTDGTKGKIPIGRHLA